MFEWHQFLWSAFAVNSKVCIGLTNLFDFKNLFRYHYIVQRHIFFAQELLFQWHYVCHVHYSPRTPNTIFSTKTRTRLHMKDMTTPGRCCTRIHHDGERFQSQSKSSRRLGIKVEVHILLDKFSPYLRCVDQKYKLWYRLYDIITEQISSLPSVIFFRF